MIDNLLLSATIREKRAKALFKAIWRWVELESPEVLLIGFVEDCLPLCKQIEINIWLQAKTLEEALYILQEHPDVLLTVVCCDIGDKNAMDAPRALRQGGFFGWMIAVHAKNNRIKQTVRAEYDFSCSMQEICDVVRNLM